MLCADPSPWLCVSDAIKEKNKNKPYDPKKSVWVPNKGGVELIKFFLVAPNLLISGNESLFFNFRENFVEKLVFFLVFVNFFPKK
jgi:hypothetical protein